MKKKELNDIKIKTQDELKNLVAQKKLELIKNKVKIAGGDNKNLKVNWTLRKEIAQIMSILKTIKTIK